MSTTDSRDARGLLTCRPEGCEPEVTHEADTRCSLTLVLALGASTIRTRHTRAEGWANVRVPVAAHFGEPEHGFESGLHLDFLAVVPLGDETGKERAYLRVGTDLGSPSGLPFRCARLILIGWALEPVLRSLR